MIAVVPALIGAGAAIIGGGLSLFGGSQANKARRQEAQRNRQFQERMRNTEWQAGVADMEAAGLNPALAYQQGGASSPSGNMAQQQDVVTPAISSAKETMRFNEELKLLKAQTSKTTSEAGIARAKELVERIRSFYLTGIQNSGTPDARQPLQKLIEAEINAMEQRARQSGYSADTMAPLASLMRMLTGGVDEVTGKINLAEVLKNFKGKFGKR